jgi:sec-independent protein translocase protein TatB
MPSLGDSAVIIFLGLLLFGPKGLAQIARQLGKLMGEFRRASNEFRMQMEEELRLAEQADRQKEIAKIEAAAPPAPALPGYADNCPEDHPHLRALPADTILDPVPEPVAEAVAEIAPVPIATSGELSIMPPATGLPTPRSSSARSSSLGPLIDSVPHAEASNGHVEPVDDSLAHKPMRYTNHNEDRVPAPAEVVDAAAEESVHG